MALQGAWFDCGLDLHKQLIEFGEAAKMWMTAQVEYEPVNPLANKQSFKQYLSASPTRIFKRDEPDNPFQKTSYIDLLLIITDQIRESNANYLRDESGFRLVKVLNFILKMVKYAFVEERGWQPFSKFLSKTKAVINIQNND